jgi:hypothetical protein
VSPQSLQAFFLNSFTLEDGTNRLSRNVGDYQSTLRAYLAKAYQLMLYRKIMGVCGEGKAIPLQAWTGP